MLFIEQTANIFICIRYTNNYVLFNTHLYVHLLEIHKEYTCTYMYFKCQFRCRHNTHAHAQYDVLTCVCKYVCPSD